MVARAAVARAAVAALVAAAEAPVAAPAGLAALAAVARTGAAHRPDVPLLDIRTPKLDGLDTTRCPSGSHGPRTVIVIVTTVDLDGYLRTALPAERPASS
ncbi:response regulator transcription factor [Streptomyces sp. NRRL F-2664]|uniref:response regulator transcription factor n=1 Tax=Streptomyces sp. NRRL F-2664 TaxID=1463842 RepID=UPI00068AFAEE|nr:response regulator transcription factor [Streptomyces sp. NRRL F-2664]